MDQHNLKDFYNKIDAHIDKDPSPIRERVDYLYALLDQLLVPSPMNYIAEQNYLKTAKQRNRQMYHELRARNPLRRLEFQVRKIRKSLFNP